MDASTLCENVMDPAHLPYTHHMTISSRGKAQPIPFANLSPLRPDGFEADRPTEGWPGKVTFKAPHLVLAETHRGEGSFSDWNVVYAVPTAPGKCRLLVRVVFETAAMKPPLKWILSFAFNTQPTWWTHLGNHVILEDDNPFLHTQGFNYRDGDAEKLAPSWATRLYMPSTSDSMVIAFRRWLDQYTDGCGASWSDYMPRAALRGSTGSTRSTGSNGQGEWRRSTREEVLERMDSHVKHCACCSGALANLQKGRALAEATVVVGLAVAGLVTKLRGAGCVLSALAFAVGRACASLEARMRVGKYPPPRNILEKAKLAASAEIGM